MLTNLRVATRDVGFDDKKVIVYDGDTDNHDMVCIVDPDNIIQGLRNRETVENFAYLLSRAPELLDMNVRPIS